MFGFARRIPALLRRGGRSPVVGGPAPFDPLLVDPAQQIALWREDYVDSAGAVAPWQNTWNPGTRDLSNGTPANRPTITDPDAVFGDNPSYTWDGTTDAVAVAGDVTSFRPLHDGTGVLAWGVFRPTVASGTQIIFTTATASAVNTGCILRYVGTTQALRLLVVKGSSPSLIDAESAPGSAPVDTLIRWVYVFADGSWSLTINGVIVMSGTPVGAPSAGNHTNALYVGRDTTASSFFAGKMAELGISTLPSSQRGAVAAYLAARYP